MGSGADVAMEAAAVTLLRNDLRRWPWPLVCRARRCRTIRQNLFWAFFYNVAGIPLAAGALLPWTGLELSPCSPPRPWRFPA